MKIHVFSYEDSILEYIAGELAVNGSDSNKDLSKYALVFPGKRPALYLQDIFLRNFNIESKDCLPSMFSISEFIGFIAEKSRGKKAECDRINAPWFLYEIIKYAQKNGLDFGDSGFFKKMNKFDDFFFRGLQLFDAINELDEGLVDNKIIGNIKSFYSAYVPENIGRFYKHLSFIRDKFHEKLKEKDLTTSGLNYYEATNFLNNTPEFISRKFQEFEKIYFLGLSFPSNGEADIIKALVDCGIAEFYIQIESLKDRKDYFKNIVKKCEGEEIEIVDLSKRVNPDGLGLAADTPDSSMKDSVLHLYEAGNTHSELLIFKNVLEGIGFNPEKTAVILLDAATLLPFLYYTVEQINNLDYNITMGYPLKRTPLYSLIRFIFNAQESAVYDNNSTLGRKYAAKDYLNLIKHPYVKASGGTDKITVINNIEKYILKKGDAFVRLADIEKDCFSGEYGGYEQKQGQGRESKSDIGDQSADKDALISVNAIHEYFFINFENNKITSMDFAKNLLKIIELIAQNNKSIFTYGFSYKLIKKMKESIDMFQNSYFKDELLEKKSIFRLFMYYMENKSAAFSGIPLKGMQIMGILETRVLKFDRVIIIDVNENILPPLKKIDPILPHPIRKKIGLTTYSDYESIYRYHFRRLISGSKEAHIVYVKSNKRIRSRLVEEIIWENEKKTKSLDIEGKIIPLGFKTKIFKSGGGFSIDKNDDILKILDDLAGKLSASAIDTYIDCPVRFYYRYILKLKETKHLKAGIGADKIGIFVHRALRRFYEGIQRNGYDIVYRFLKDDGYFKDEIYRAIEEPYNIAGLGIDADFGEYFIVKETAKKILYNFIKNDLKNCKTDKYIWNIIGLESEKEARFRIEDGIEKGREIRLYGKIDRIDGYKDKDAKSGGIGGVDASNESGERFLIIDYKTGSSSVMPDIKKILNRGGKKPVFLNKREDIKELIKSFQLPIYLYLFKTEQNMENYGSMDACLNLTGLTGSGKNQMSNEGGHRLYLLGNQTEKSAANFDLDAENLMEDIFLPSLQYIIGEILNKDIPFIPDNLENRTCEYCPYHLLCGKV